MVEINETERGKKRIKRNEDNVKFPNIQIIGVPEEKDQKKKTMRKYLRRQSLKTSLKWGRK